MRLKSSIAVWALVLWVSGCSTYYEPKQVDRSQMAEIYLWSEVPVYVDGSPSSPKTRLLRARVERIDNEKVDTVSSWETVSVGANPREEAYPFALDSGYRKVEVRVSFALGEIYYDFEATLGLDAEAGKVYGLHGSFDVESEVFEVWYREKFPGKAASRRTLGTLIQREARRPLAGPGH